MSLVSLLKQKSNKTLFTTPSHGGDLCIMHKFYQWYRNDISETDAYNPQEALAKAEQKAAKIYGTKSSHFLTNGSSGGIIAAVLASCKCGDKVLVWENAHRCHKNAIKLAGAEEIIYSLPYNKDLGVYEGLTKEQAEKIISKEKNVRAIIVTSPSYEGIISDVKGIAEVCRKYNIIYIADEAHGALYPFSDELPESAVKHADFTVQSLHKTAGGINPTALLHCNCNINPEEALNLITTTSPSYPMLATIEANINYLASKRGKKNISELINNIKNIKSELKNLDFYGDDITKLLIKKEGMSGYELSELLYNKYNIEDERANEKSVMLLTGLGTTKAKLQRLSKLKKI